MVRKIERVRVRVCKRLHACLCLPEDAAGAALAAAAAAEAVDAGAAAADVFGLRPPLTRPPLTRQVVSAVHSLHSLAACRK